MKYYHQLIASLIIAVLLFTGCNPHPGVKEYEAFVYGHSDSIADVYSEIEYDIHSKEKYEDFQPPEQIEIIIEGKTMKEVAYFVAQKLATIEYVTATATHFVLRKYKDKGVIYGPAHIDERGNI
jgi:DNA-binding Lrp family transcriptional regulator